MGQDKLKQDPGLGCDHVPELQVGWLGVKAEAPILNNLSSNIFLIHRRSGDTLGSGTPPGIPLRGYGTPGGNRNNLPILSKDILGILCHSRDTLGLGTPQTLCA